MKVVALILSFIFVVFVLSATAIVQADETAPEFSVSFRASSPQTSPQKTSRKKIAEQVEGNGTTTASLIVSGSAVYFGVYDYNKNGRPHELTVFFDVDSDEETEFYAVFYWNLYGDWFTNDNFKSDVYTINGYNPKEGIYMDIRFGGYQSEMNMGIKIEIYRRDGSLVCVYGPDGNTKNIPFEGEENDVKENPFTSQTPSPSPTPTPAQDVNEIKLNYNAELDINKLILRKGKSITVSAEALSDGEAIPDAEIEAEADNGAVSVSPSVATTDENGLAEFTITAKKKGNAKISFTSGDAKKVLRVKVK